MVWSFKATSTVTRMSINSVVPRGGIDQSLEFLGLRIGLVLISLWGVSHSPRAFVEVLHLRQHLRLVSEVFEPYPQQS